VSVDGAAQIVCDPLANVGRQILFSVRAESVRHRDDENGEAREDKDIAGSRAGSCEDEPMEPAVLILALEEVVEHDFERPGLKQAGDAFAGDRQQAQPQLSIVRPQQFKDVQTTPGVHCLRNHMDLDADLSTCERLDDLLLTP
jgi:hypothetical protein